MFFDRTGDRRIRVLYPISDTRWPAQSLPFFIGTGSNPHRIGRENDVEKVHHATLGTDRSRRLPHGGGLTARGLKRFLVLFFIDLSTRRVEIAGVASHANGLLMSQIAREVTDAVDGIPNGKRYLIHDRDPLFTAEFQSLLAAVAWNVELLLLRRLRRSFYYCGHHQSVSAHRKANPTISRLATRSGPDKHRSDTRRSTTRTDHLFGTRVRYPGSGY